MVALVVAFRPSVILVAFGAAIARLSHGLENLVPEVIAECLRDGCTFENVLPAVVGVIVTIA
jgi:hypothetical protein